MDSIVIKLCLKQSINLLLEQHIQFIYFFIYFNEGMSFYGRAVLLITVQQPIRVSSFNHSVAANSLLFCFSRGYIIVVSFAKSHFSYSKNFSSIKNIRIVLNKVLFHCVIGNHPLNAMALWRLQQERRISVIFITHLCFTWNISKSFILEYNAFISLCKLYTNSHKKAKHYCCVN